MYHFFIRTISQRRRGAATTSVIAYVIKEIFIMREDVFYVSHYGFVSGVMVLVERGERESVPIGDISLLNILF